MADTLTGYSNAPIERRSLKVETAHHYFIPASYQAFRILHFGFVMGPLVAGMDKFLNILTDWAIYLSPRAEAAIGFPAETFMKIVGGIEILAALLVAFKPRVGGLLVAIWLWGIIVNLISFPEFYDVALRDFGLSLGALALSRLSVEFDNYRRNPPRKIKHWRRLSA